MMETGKIIFSEDGTEALVETIYGYWFYAQRSTRTYVKKRGFWEEKSTGRPAPGWIVSSIERATKS